MREKEEAYRILEAALSIASTGVDEAEVGLRGGELGLARFADNQLHPASQMSHERLSVRLGLGGRWARVSTSDLSTSGITAAAQQARAELERLPEGSSRDALPAPQSYAEIAAYDEETASLHALERTALAARAITAAHRGGVTASGLVAVARGAIDVAGFPRSYALANTRGLLAYHPATRATFEVRMASGPREGRARQVAVAASALDPRATVESVLWALEGRAAPAALPPGRYAAVLEPSAVAALLRFVGQEAGAAKLERGESFLAGRIGQSIVDPRISVYDDFSHPEHLGPPFDADGVARQRVAIIEAGVARAPVVAWSTSLASAHAPTGHGTEAPGGRRGEGAEHLVMSGGEGSSDRLARSIRAGVSISGFSGLELLEPRSLRVTGCTAFGTYAIDGGVVSAPVGELRFDVSLLELFSRVRDLGAPVAADGLVVPPLAVDGLPLYAAS